MNTTPGYNVRLRIRFSADRNGRPLAHYWSMAAGRYIRIGHEDAKFWVATGQATVGGPR